MRENVVHKQDKTREAVVLDILSETMAMASLDNDSNRTFTVRMGFMNGYGYNTALSIAGEAGFVPTSIHIDKDNRSIKTEFSPIGEVALETYKSHESNFTDGDLYELLSELDHYEPPHMEEE